MFSEIVTTASGLVCLLTLLSMLIKPVREWLLGIKEQRKSTKEQQEGIKCLLRAEIVRLYYKHQDSRTLQEYEWGMLDACYQAYRRLGGNSFIVKLYEEMKEWSIAR